MSDTQQMNLNDPDTSMEILTQKFFSAAKKVKKNQYLAMEISNYKHLSPLEQIRHFQHKFSNVSPFEKIFRDKNCSFWKLRLINITSLMYSYKLRQNSYILECPIFNQFFYLTNQNKDERSVELACYGLLFALFLDWIKLVDSDDYGQEFDQEYRTLSKEALQMYWKYPRPNFLGQGWAICAQVMNDVLEEERMRMTYSLGYDFSSENTDI